MYELLVLTLFPGAMAFAAASDLFSMTISNRLSLLLVAAFAVMAVLAGLDLATLALHLSAGLAMLALGFVLFAMGWVGGGDAKLFAATALWLGWELLLPYVFAASVFGGLLTMALLMFRQTSLPQFARAESWAVRLHAADTGIPYGIALAAAGLLVYSQSPWMLPAG